MRLIRRMLRVENLLKKYDTLPVLDGVNFSVSPGEMVFVLGSRGSGKSTLLRAVAGLTEIDAGKIIAGDVEITRLPAQKRSVGFVAQTPAIWPQMTVRENIAFDLEQRRLAPEAVRAAVDSVLARLSVESLGNRRPAQLSAGETQLAALARALVLRPRLLLLDEPFVHLPESERRSFFDLVRRVAGETGACAVCATNDCRLALATADRVAVFSGGKILQTGTPLEVYRRPQSRFAANLFGAANHLAGTIIAAGAGEFLAKTNFGEIRGALVSGNGGEPPPGTPVDVVIRPEALHVDVMPPDENAFAGDIVATAFFGETERCSFVAKDNPTEALMITRLNPTRAEGVFEENVFAWVAPEDVVGIV